jgi:asparagine synthase (glutamine-hydrolysing)
MCGIFGISHSQVVEQNEVEVFLDGLKNRGPDSQSYHAINSNFVLGMTRLAINGIENKLNQPMINPENGDVLIFNGEIYNFEKLKSQLLDFGYTFKTASDTEVVLKAFQAWGTECFQKFRGMFAIAVWESRTKTLVLARDYLGEKPLYFRSEGDCLVFSSSRQLVKCYHLDSVPISQQTALEFHQYGYLSRSKNCDSTTEVKPGYFFTFKDQKLIEESSFDPTFHKGDISKKDYKSAVLDFDSLLTEVIEEEISASQVPVGIFMSGGMDSTIIAKKAAEFSPGLEIFTAAFAEKSFDESEKATRIAESLDVKHNLLLIEYDLDLILKAIGALDTPVSDTSIVPFFALSKYASQTHKVCLTGDGGDEFFGGYVTYQATMINQKLRYFSRFLRQSTLITRHLKSRQGNVDFTYKLQAFLNGCNFDSRLAHQSWRQLFSQAEIESLLGIKLEGQKNELHPFWTELRGRPILEQAMAFDAHTWLQDDILVKTDRMSMANSLELRSPFLHPEIIKFSQQIPLEFKVSMFRRKRIIRDVFDLNFPQNLSGDGGKRGFGSPMAIWIKKNPMDFKSLILEAKIYNESQIEELFDQHLSMLKDNSYRIFTLLVWSKFFDGKEISC